MLFNYSKGWSTSNTIVDAVNNITIMDTPVPYKFLVNGEEVVTTPRVDILEQKVATLEQLVIDLRQRLIWNG